MKEERKPKREIESCVALRLWISEPSVVNLHCTLHRGLMGNFPAGLLAVCETPTQSRKPTSLGTHKSAHPYMYTQWLKQHAKESFYTYANCIQKKTLSSEQTLQENLNNKSLNRERIVHKN